MTTNSLVSMKFIESVNEKSIENLLMLKENLLKVLSNLNDSINPKAINAQVELRSNKENPLGVLGSPNDSIDPKVISAQVELISNRVDYLIKSELE